MSQQNAENNKNNIADTQVSLPLTQ